MDSNETQEAVRKVKKIDNITWLKKYLKRKDITVSTSKYIQSCIDEITELRSTIRTVDMKKG